MVSGFFNWSKPLLLQDNPALLRLPYRTDPSMITDVRIFYPRDKHSPPETPTTVTFYSKTSGEPGTREQNCMFSRVCKRFALLNYSCNNYFAFFKQKHETTRTLSCSGFLIVFENNWVFHDKHFRRISVRLSDRSKVTQNKINFIKNCPQWGLNSQPPDHQSHALLTELGRNLLEMSEVSFLLFHAPLYMLVSGINRAWLYKESDDSHPQPNSDLAQLAEHGADDLVVVSSNPTKDNFWRNLFCSV